MSKFDYGSFTGGYDVFAVNSEKFSLEEAIKIFEEYYPLSKVGKEIGQYSVSNAFVKWRAGVNEDHEPCVCWWLEYSKRPKGSCPIYAFHKRQKNNREWGNEIIN